MNSIRRDTLDSGLRVVTEAVADMRSVTLGAWVDTGARHERVDSGEWGASHFLEHLVFKGSPTRGAHEIALAVESVGGEMNAFTTHEQTVFFVRVPAVHLGLAADILCDVLWNPAFRDDEVESERQVILEEIRMRDDSPEDLVHDLLGSALFPGHPLGREVIGSRESITEMPREAICGYHARRYVPSRVVVAAAGALDHTELVDLLAARAPSDRPDRDLDVAATAELSDPLPRVSVERDIEQTHLLVGIRSLDQLDPDRYALAVLNQALGGGMSSRLFQSVREDRGLAYSVYSYRAGFTDTGLLAVYAGSAPQRAAETFAVVDYELDRLVAEGSLSDDELAWAVGAITGSLSLSLESSSARMRRVGNAELVDGDVVPVEELIARVEAVDRDDVGRVVDRVLRDAARTLVSVGPADRGLEHV